MSKQSAFVLNLKFYTRLVLHEILYIHIMLNRCIYSCAINDYNIFAWLCVSVDTVMNVVVQLLRIHANSRSYHMYNQWKAFMIIRYVIYMYTCRYTIVL